MLKKLLFPIKFAALIATILLAIAYVVSAYSGMVNPEKDAKFAIIGLGYPLLFSASLLVLGLWLIFKQWWLAAITACSLIATADPLTTFFPFGSSQEVADTSETFTLLTFNVMNFDDFDGTVHEPNRTVQYILQTDADIVCLQEGAQGVRFTSINVIQNSLPELIARYPYYTNGTDDMVLLSKYPFELCDEYVTSSERKKVVAYNINIKGHTVKIFNCHLQSIGLTMSDKEIYKQITEIDGINHIEPIDAIKEVRSNLFSKLSAAFKQRAKQAHDLRELIDSSGKDVIVCGDFNDTPGSYSYRTVRGDDMHDAYNDCANGPTITYHDNRFFFKIDHVLYRGDLKAIAIKRGDIDSSDHYPLIATFAFASK